MPRVRLPKDASLSDLVIWAANGGAHFVIARDSGFSFFTEPVAISLLYQLLRAGARTTADILYTLPDFNDLDEANATKQLIGGAHKTVDSKLGLLNTLFGLGLLDTAATIAEGRDGPDISDRLREALWRRLSINRGIVGSGDYVAIISRDPDMPLPAVLRETPRAAGTRAFPFRNTFAELLKRVGREMGITDELIASPLEDALVTFLYEIAKNAHDHGRTGLDGLALSGVRGLTVQKLRAESLDELQSRSALPHQLRTYLSRAWSPSSAPGVLVALSIVDTGPGIHRTLAPRPGETDWERLGRAFLPGESSKPPGIEGRGQGLYLMVDALRSCQALRAFLFVRSANLLAYRDFTDPDFQEAYRAQPYALQPWGEEVPCEIGSSLTVVWPILTTSPLQGELPLQSTGGIS